MTAAAWITEDTGGGCICSALDIRPGECVVVSADAIGFYPCSALDWFGADPKYTGDEEGAALYTADQDFPARDFLALQALTDAQRDQIMAEYVRLGGEDAEETQADPYRRADGERAAKETAETVRAAYDNAEAALRKAGAL